MSNLIFKAAILGVAVISAASAGIITADFNESLDLPAYISAGPLTLQSNGVDVTTASAPQLTSANTISNPTPWNNVLNIGFDPATNILTLTGDGGNSYQTISASLNNILFSQGEVITGITPISTGNAVYSNEAPYSVTTSFTDNSFSVNYSVQDVNSPQVFLIQTLSDTFQVTTSASAAPEPASLGLMGIGAVALLFRARRRFGTW